MKKGYTEEGLEEMDAFFGLFLLETNIPKSKYTAEEVFSHYKERWTIETFYNYVRNKCDFNALYQQDYFMCQGLSFLVTISGMIFNDIQERLAPTGLSVVDVLETVGKLKISFESNEWNVKNKVKNVRDICDKIGFDIPVSVT